VTRIVLASASPRRKALLRALGLTFDVIVSDAEEITDGPPEEAVVTNARAKRNDVAARLDSPALVIAADTLVVIDGEALGKPADLDEARAMIRRLSGRTHQVLTGIAIRDMAAGCDAEGTESTDVTFRHLPEDSIRRFVDAVKPTDRAGAYTVDGPGSLLVERYSGCYQNVLGLPMVRLDILFGQLGYNLFEMMHPPRAVFL